MKTTKRCPGCKIKFTRIHTVDKPPKFCSRACANKAPGRMTEEIKSRIGLSGPDHPGFKGGWKARGGKGDKEYFFTWIAPEERHKHPTVNKRGYIHRSHYAWNNAHPDDLVFPGQIVHHENRNSLDDSPDNLVKDKSQSEHLKNHHTDDWNKSRNKKREKSGRYS